MNGLKLLILSAIFFVICGFLPTQSAAEIPVSEATDTTKEEKLQSLKPTSPRNLRIDPGKAIKKSGSLDFAKPNKLPDANVDVFYEKQLQVSGGIKPFSYSKASPSLPPGLSISPAGTISGKPTKSGTYRFVIQVWDKSLPVQRVNKMFELTIRDDFTTIPAKPLPVIVSLISAPIGALKPGSRLYIKGNHFGSDPGKILMSGSFPGPVELVQVEWKDDSRVNGVVPYTMEGQANQYVKIQVLTVDGSISNYSTIGFQGRVEFTCEGYIISGTDGSQKDCTPYKCMRDAMGVRCRSAADRCESNLDCAPGSICTAERDCKIWAPVPEPGDPGWW